MKLIHWCLVIQLVLVQSLFIGTNAHGDGRSLYYYDDASLLKLAKKGTQLVFFSTGWSGSAMGKMYKKKTRIKQARGFSIAYSLALRMNHLGIKGKVFYLTTQQPNEAQRRYLFNLHQSATQDNVPSPSSALRKSKSKEEEFKEFEQNYFEHVQFSTKNLKRNLPAHDERRYFYLFEGKNSEVIRARKKEVQQLKDEGAYFAGIEYHFGGPFFQEFKTALGLDKMRLLGSEIYDQLGDEDPEAPDNELRQDSISNWEDVSLPKSFTEKRRLESKIPKDLGTKSQCRRLYRDIGVAHARGSYIPVRDVDSLVDELYTFLKANHDVENFVVKLERSSAGDGNRVYKFKEIFAKYSDFYDNKELALEVIKTELKTQFSEAYVRRIHDHGAVFEAFISGERFKSPAVLGMIMPKSVEVYFDYNQLLGGEHGQTYMGSLGPASNQKMIDFKKTKSVVNETDLTTPSVKILEGLRECGARGAVGVDFVTCDETQPDGSKERKCYAIENNVRHTGTMYPYRTFFYLVGREIMEKSYFTSTDSVKVKAAPEGYSQKMLNWFYQDLLLNSKYKYNPMTKSGCLVYIDTWALGKVGIACIASTEKELGKLFDGFKESISTEVEQFLKTLK